MASRGKTLRAAISWEGDSIEVLRAWPKPIREDFGVALGEMQEGRPAALPVRPMLSIAAGVFELKDSDESKWYRVVYVARHKDTIYVLHCFTKNTAKTEKRELATAERRWKDVQRRLREGEELRRKSNPDERQPHLTRGSALDDLGFGGSELLEIKVKAEIYRELLKHIQEAGLPQRELGAVLGIHQPDVSNLLNGRISKFSVGKLIKFAGKLNLGAEVRLTKDKPAKPVTSRQNGRRAVAAA